MPRFNHDLNEHEEPYQDITIRDGSRRFCKVWIDDAPDHQYNSEQIEYARRIVACLNACEGFETVQLEQMRYPLREMLDQKLSPLVFNPLNKPKLD